MTNINDLRLSKNMKYTALYWAMRFNEIDEDIYEKIFPISGDIITIFAADQKVFLNNEFSFILNTHESFVKLECINRLLTIGYGLNDIEIHDEYLIFKKFNIKFIVWETNFPDSYANNNIFYKSRLISGVLEYKTKIFMDEIYDYGVFESLDSFNFSKITKNNYENQDFIIEENRVIKYIGNSKKVVVPEGITELESCAFWDNQSIEEVVLPKTLENMGGDTFYYCKNLKKLTIPKNTKSMGNNPFAGCPKLEIKNESPYFNLKNGVLYTSDMDTLIYCAIKGSDEELVIPEGIKVITKHAFYCCNRLKRITLPTSLQKMENNPFSGCSKLELKNNSKSYFIEDDVIYNKFKTSVIGCLNKISTEKLFILEGVKTINRNSFWNCKGIKEIVFPKSLEDIGYNPFVECSNIKFVSHSDSFKVIDDVLYNKDCSKLICYPSWKAVGEVDIPETVTTLERGAFSGCKNMTSINLRNVNIISKSCFSNCINLEKIYCSDLVTYIGEWAFAYCTNLKEISIRKGTVIDNNALSNCNANIVERDFNSNYLIESDNLYTLKSMHRNYKEKIDSILIDPPYNSHIDYIGYKDGEYEEGYLNFMQCRLELSYTLLSNEGFLVINIDEGEVNNLFDLCAQIFGKNLVSIHKWKKIHPYFDKNRIVLNPNKKQTDYEYIIVCRKTINAKLNKIMQPYIRDERIFQELIDFPEIFDCYGTTSSAKDEINEIFGRRDYFSTPKPVKLMKELIRATTNKSSIVLDFFAGSGTVGQAVNELNIEDNGNRSFILVSNSESNICQNVTKKRLDKFNIDYMFLK